MDAAGGQIGAGPGVHVAVGIIMVDRPCGQCGYNLRGLPEIGRCPECGAAVRPAKNSRYADNLTDAPMSYLRLVAAGLGLMAASTVVWIGWSLLTIVTSFGLSLNMLIVVDVSITLGTAAGWLAGSVIATARRPKSPTTAPDWLLDSEALRAAARFSQVAPPLAGAFAIVSGALGGAWVSVVGSALVVASLVALTPLCVYLSGLADWAGDTGVSARMRAAAWCLTVCSAIAVAGTAILQIPGFPVKFLVLVIVLLTSLATVVGGVMLVVGVVQLSLTALWAMQNALASDARNQRLAEKRRREADEHAARAFATQDPPSTGSTEPGDRAHAGAGDESHDDPLAFLDDDEPVPLAEAPRPDRGLAPGSPGESSLPPPGVPRPRGQNVIERRSDDSDPYDVAPDDDPAR